MIPALTDTTSSPTPVIDEVIAEEAEAISKKVCTVPKIVFNVLSSLFIYWAVQFSGYGHVICFEIVDRSMACFSVVGFSLGP